MPYATTISSISSRFPLPPPSVLHTLLFLTCLSRSPDCYHGFPGSPLPKNIFFAISFPVILFASPFIKCFLRFILSRSGLALLKLRLPFVFNFTAPPMRRTSFLRRSSHFQPCISSSLFDLAATLLLLVHSFSFK